ncbi:Metalloprotease [Cubamyces sp. BRFM 1775]|nr:Metalloprotease [Cubamyces sp. BRFM 1775]
MQFTSIVLILVATAASTLAAPDLLLQITAHSPGQDTDSLKVLTTIQNSGDVPLELLNDPRSPLSNLPTDTFTIVNGRGISPDFVGIEVKYSPQLAATSGDSLAITYLAPGQSVQVEHDIALAYNFSTSGPGLYTVNLKPHNVFHNVFHSVFHYVSGNHSSELLVEAGTSSHVLNVSRSIASQTRATPRSEADTKECDDWQHNAVRGAIPHAKHYVANAIAELSRAGYKGDNYKRWFGAPSDHRLQTVISHFEALIANNFTEFTYVCKTKFCSHNSGVFAYVYPDEFGKIHVCDMFFRSPVGGPDSRASTIVHESTHFTRNGGTQDHAYGQRLTQDLARSYPQLAVMNADNHEYFAVNAEGEDFRERPALFAQTSSEGPVLEGRT